jgi:hypothetical protein
MHSYLVSDYHKPKVNLSKDVKVVPLQLARSDKDECPLHNCILQLDTVHIGYGLIMPDTNRDRYLDAERENFPWAAVEGYNGGCVVGRYFYEEVLFCPICRLIRQDWIDRMVAKTNF